MRRNLFKIALIVVLIAGISGCAELRRKFVRKKKPKKEEYSFYSPQEYKPKPPHERYQDHYILWHSWQLDLIRTDGTSHLRDMRAIDESLKHLSAMRDLLEKDKAEEINEQIKKMDALRGRLKKSKKDILKDVRSRRAAEKVERIIINRFGYNRMKDYIKKPPGGGTKESGGK